MTQMKDSQLDPRWLVAMMQGNPPKKLDNGLLLTGPVRLAFPNLYKPREKKNEDDGNGGKYGATVMFPSGVNLNVFGEEWTRAAREAFPKNWNGSQPIGLHSPFHDQAEKTVGVKPLMGFTPGAVYMNVSSQYKPQVVDMNMNPVVDETKVYPGVWAILSLNTYHYSNKKTGVGFGLQSVMIIADDTKLGGTGSDPRQDFAGISITAQSNIGEKMAQAAANQPTTTGIMPVGGFVGSQGNLPVQALPATADDLY